VTRPALGERGRRKLAGAGRPTLRRARRRRWPSGCAPKGTRSAWSAQFPTATAPSSRPKPSPAKSPFPAARSSSARPGDAARRRRRHARTARAGAGRGRPLAEALRRFDAGGSIGIDFPTLADKADRRAVDEALAAALAGWPHERTAMNGFGFVQLVARLERPSLLHRASVPARGMAARKLLRQAELLQGRARAAVGPSGARGAAQAEWLAELARRTGREVRWEARPGLAIEAPQAQLVPR
jgi:hypothetical protein